MLIGSPAKTAQTNELHDALKLKPNYEYGRTLYETCAACHQPDGRRAANSGAPNIAGQHYQVIIKQLADFRDIERLDLRMEAFASRHYLKGPQELADVAACISSLLPQPTQDFGSGQFSNLGMQCSAYTVVEASDYWMDSAGPNLESFAHSCVECRCAFLFPRHSRIHGSGNAAPVVRPLLAGAYTLGG